MADEQRQLARKLKDKFTSTPAVYRRGTVVSVGATTATVTIGEDDIPGIIFYSHVTGLTAGSKVDVRFDNGCPVIIGKTA